MKKYNDYVFEAVSQSDFNDKFEDICDKLDEFWSNLDIAFDALEDFNSKDPEKVLTANAEKTASQMPTFIKPVQNGRYEYTTKKGNIEIVDIIIPESSPNTAQVKPIDPPGPNHSAEWSKLKPYQKKPAVV